MSFSHPFRIRIEAKFALLRHIPGINDFTPHWHRPRVVARTKRGFRNSPSDLVRTTFVCAFTRNGYHACNWSLSNRSAHRLFLPNVKDEPRRELARRVHHSVLDCDSSSRSSFGRTRRDSSRRWLWRLVGPIFLRKRRTSEGSLKTTRTRRGIGSSPMLIY